MKWETSNNTALCSPLDGQCKHDPSGVYICLMRYLTDHFRNKDYFTITTLISYITFSFLKRFSTHEVLMVIPCILCLSNLVLLSIIGHRQFIRKDPSMAFQKKWLFGISGINCCLCLLIFSYLFSW